MIDWPASDWDEFIKKAKSSGSSAIKNVIKKITINPFGWTKAVETTVAELGKALGKLAFYTYFNNPQKQRNDYFKYVEWDEKSKSFRLKIEHNNTEEWFNLTYDAKYQPDEGYDPRLALPLKHFSNNMQKFLLYFNEMVWGIKTTASDRKKLAKEWGESEIPSEINTYLMGLKIEKSGSGQDIVSLKDVNFTKAKKSTSSAAATPIHEFRLKFSSYLRQNTDEIIKILSAINDKRNAEIYAAFVGENSTVGTIKDTFYVGVNIPVPTVNDKIKLLKSLHDNKVSIKSYVIAPGSKVDKIEGGVFIGVNLDGGINSAFTFPKEAILKIGNKQEELDDKEGEL